MPSNQPLFAGAAVPVRHSPGHRELHAVRQSLPGDQPGRGGGVLRGHEPVRTAPTAGARAARRGIVAAACTDQKTRPWAWGAARVGAVAAVGAGSETKWKILKNGNEIKNLEIQ